MALDEEVAGAQDPREAQIRKTLQTGRLIVVALCSGLIVFTGVVLVWRNEPAAAELSMFTVLALVITGVHILLQFFVPRIMMSVAQRRSQANLPAQDRLPKLLLLYLNILIAGASLCEGAALLCLTVYLVEGNLSLLAATLVMGFLVARRLPTREGLEAFLEAQQPSSNADPSSAEDDSSS